MQFVIFFSEPPRPSFRLAQYIVLTSKIHQEIAKMSRKGLMEQDLSKLDVTKLHPLSPEVISRQATINIGILFTY